MNKTYIQVREVGLRDGLQMISYLVPTETKCRVPDDYARS